jgi:PTS system nitrogen regulatory IIA component
MITLADTLTPRHIALEPDVQDRAGAILQTAALLRDDPRVVDWDDLYSLLCRSLPCRCEDEDDFAICLPHARTDSVTSMVMSVSRFTPPLEFPESAKAVRYLFVIGAPVAMAADYLRIVGLLVRVVRSPTSEAALRQARTSEEFLEILTSFEVNL